jgi:hypothetical protein
MHYTVVVFIGDKGRNIMPKEEYREVTHLPTSGEVTGQSDVVHLTGNPVVQRKPVPVKSDPNHPMINMSDYQKQLLEEIKKRPEIMKLFKSIFQDYPLLVTREYRMSSPTASRRQKLKSREVSMERLKMEAFIEESICRLAGINVNEIAAENIEKPELTSEEVEEVIDAEVALQEEVKQRRSCRVCVSVTVMVTIPSLLSKSNQ